jgi:hypothetical protein
MPPGKLSTALRKKSRWFLSATAVAVAALATTVLTTGSAAAAAPAPTMQSWQNSVAQFNAPAGGCYTAAYPSTAWRDTACTTAPNLRYEPGAGATTSGAAVGGAVLPAAAGSTPDIVGNGIDYSANVSGLLIGATGSFLGISGVTSENQGGTPNSYSLQLNSAPFTSPVCAGHAGCAGWEQFIFANPGTGPSTAFIQFWILNYFTTCPAGWGSYLSDCYTNGPAVSVPTQPITSLANLKLSGNVTASTDTVVMQTASASYSVPAADSTLGLSTAWNTVEFMIGGNGGGSTASFNTGSTITVQTVTHNGTTAAPSCLYEGFTGETNNLNLVGTAAYTPGASPSLQSRQSNLLTSPASCASSHGTGDTHIQTLGGTYYDFQAYGVFEALKTSTMNVQEEQVSAAPIGYPLATDNGAVGVQMGSDSVAFCASTSNVVVDGAVTAIASGSTITLPSGDLIARSGTQYVVMDPQGDSLQADFQTLGGGKYIDDYPGVGSWPQPAFGLMANAPGTNNELQTSTGVVLPTPVSLNTLYTVFGDSWRVPDSQALTAVCGDKVVDSDPTAPFWADELPQTVEAQAQAVCTKDGVQNATLVEACTLDVAVLGTPAAQAYVGEPAPVDVAFSEDTGSGGTTQNGVRSPASP